MNRVYFVRHGENLANLTKEFSYKTVDYSLTAKGILQAQQTAEYLSTIPVGEVYSSPLKRCIETASIVAERLGRLVQVAEDLREVNVGFLEGQPVTQANWDTHNAIIDAWRAGFPEVSFPGGENQYQLAQRLDSVLKQILGRGTQQHIVVVGHGGLFTFGLPMLCPQLELSGLLSVPNHNGSITTFDIDWESDHYQAQLQHWAQTDHLSGYAADFVHGVPRDGELEQ